ncbi:MAG: isoleucine--tRNA ligase [Actinomycetota bacterium]
MNEQAQPYPDVPSQPDLPGIERRIIESWEREGTFERSVDQRPDDAEYVFNDGPPFANGLPHYGHLLTGYVKDVVPRYQAMRGKKVERRFGWDCHGLPPEMQAENELGVHGRAAITKYGIDRFNEYCATSVLRFTEEWETYVNRQARWVDFDHDYKTMDLDYMESVMWAFKTLHDRGLVYEDYRVLPYSWGAETPLSNFEIRMDDATRPRQDPAITVRFVLHPVPEDDGVPTSLLAWTTTPWTLPSNLALAVGPDLEYVVLERDGERVVLGAETVPGYSAELGDWERVGTLTGADLVERTYEPMFRFFADTPNSFRVLGADFIDTTEGTGVVHIAPGFGEDDQRLGAEAGVGLVVPVDDAGRFTAPVADYEGLNVFDANPEVIKDLKARGVVVRHETYDHNYPHCWRTDTPIIYRALSSWYVEVTQFRDRMVELNQQINWIPAHVRDGSFGQWIANARDWSISRNRFWGAPIPVWKSDDPEYPRVDVYGSLDEIERDFGVRPTDLHRPMIDELVRPNPDDPTGRSMMRRVPEVLDCWFESGSMPFAQLHYPFENVDVFERRSPADFIVEYIGQTRGWFYSLHVLATALFDRPAFENVICHGVVLDENGQKLSKKLRNYPDPVDVFEQQGSDSLRWYLMASAILRGGDLRISRDGAEFVDVIRRVVNPIWNAYSFFTLYANVDGYRASERSDSEQLLDRYILAKTRELVETVQARMDAYDLAGSTAEIEAFLDALTNWYIRRSRDRFWAPSVADGGDADDKGDAHDTLYTVLVTLTRVAAPFLPMITEEIHRNLTGEESIHLRDWPDAAALPADHDLVAAMDQLRATASTALRLREERGLRIRLPLRRLTVAGADAERLAPFVDLLADELNVKEVELTTDITEHAEFVLRPNGKVLGPRLGGDVQKVFGAAKQGLWEQLDDGTVSCGGAVLAEGEFDLALNAPDGVAAAALPTNDAVVTLDTEVTPELAAEGLARDVIRAVQQARKDDDLRVTDRIAVTVDAPEDVGAAVLTHEATIAGQVLATSLDLGDVSGDGSHEAKVDGRPVRVRVRVTT